MLAAAAGLLLVAIAGAIAETSRRSGAFDWNDLKPVWWLAAEAASGGDGTYDALRELRSRLADGELTDRQIRSLADRALELQADREGPWHYVWGQLFADAWKLDLVPEVDVDRFLRQSLELTTALTLPSRMRRGAGSPYRIDFTEMRGSAYPSPFEPVPRFQIDFGDGEGLRTLVTPGKHGSSQGCTRYWIGSVSLPELPLGERVVTMVASLEFRRDGRDDPVARRSYEITQQVTIVGPEDPVFRVRSGPDVDAAMREALAIEQLSLKRSWNARAREYRSRPWLRVTVAPTLPVDASVMIAIVHEDGHYESTTGARLVRPGVGAELDVRIGRVPLDETDPPRALDVLVRSDHRNIRRLDVEEIWDGAFVIENVPITPMSAGRFWRSPLADEPADALAQRVLAELDACNEMIRRLDDDEPVPDATLTRLAGEILERQANQLEPWEPKWGDVLQTAWRKGRLPRDLIERFLAQALDGIAMTVTLPGPGRDTGPDQVDYEVTFQSDGRAARSGEFPWLVWAEAEIDGVPVALSGHGVSSIGSSLVSQTRSTSRHTTPSLTPGSHGLTVIGHFGVIEPTSRRIFRKRVPLADWPATLARTTRRIEVTLEAGPGNDPFELVADASMRPRIEAAIVLETPLRVVHASLTSPKVGRNQLTMDAPPLGVSFEVFLRHGDREWRAGWALCRPDERKDGRMRGARLENFGKDIEVVDVVFRTNADMVRGQYRPHRYWDGEIVLEDVPVEHTWR